MFLNGKLQSINFQKFLNVFFQNFHQILFILLCVMTRKNSSIIGITIFSLLTINNIISSVVIAIKMFRWDTTAKPLTLTSQQLKFILDLVVILFDNAFLFLKILINIAWYLCSKRRHLTKTRPCQYLLTLCEQNSSSIISIITCIIHIYKELRWFNYSSQFRINIFSSCFELLMYYTDWRESSNVIDKWLLTLVVFMNLLAAWRVNP